MAGQSVLPPSFSRYTVQERLSQNESLLWTGSSSQASLQTPFLDPAERRHLRLGSCHPKLFKETHHPPLTQIWTFSQYLLMLGFTQHAVDQPPTQSRVGLAVGREEFSSFSTLHHTISGSDLCGISMEI